MTQVAVLGGCGCDDEDCEVVVIQSDSDEVIKILVPGPPGPSGAIVSTGAYLAPIVTEGTVQVPADGRAQLFLRGDAAVTMVTALEDGSGTQELYIVGTDDSRKFQLNDLSNLKLSGPWRAKAGSMIKLQWIDDAQFWLEETRNEI